MASIIEFFIKYNSKLIFISFSVVCVLAAVVVWWQVFGRRGLQTGEKPDLDLSDIEDSLKKILSQTNSAISNVGNQVSGDSGAPVEMGEIKTLDGKPIDNLGAVKTELQVRAKIIEDLQIQVQSAKVGAAGAATTEMLGKIRELEGKLAEYEIIEDDIADLSFFKEENVKLKKELDSLKRAGPKMVDQFAEALEQETTPPESPLSKQDEVDAMMAAAAAKAAQAPTGKASTENESTSPIFESEAGTNLQASALAEEALEKASGLEPATLEELEDTPAPEEFEGLNSSDADMEAAVAEAQAVGSVETKPSSGVTEKDLKPSKSMEGESDDIFGEFEAEGESDDPLSALGDIDPDKMLDELKGLNSDLEAGVEALDENPDIDKLATEAVNLKAKG